MEGGSGKAGVVAVVQGGVDGVEVGGAGMVAVVVEGDGGGGSDERGLGMG